MGAFGALSVAFSHGSGSARCQQYRDKYSDPMFASRRWYRACISLYSTTDTIRVKLTVALRGMAQNEDGRCVESDFAG